MYLAEITIENFRCFGSDSKRIVIPIRPGLTALVGENDAGKSAVIDALRFALGTTDQDWFRLDDADFHGSDTSREIKIVCTFKGLRSADQRAFIEYLTYGDSDGPAVIVNWTAKDTGEVRKGRPYRRVTVHAGKDGQGPTLAPEVRDLLRATYLRPLRDAEQALAAGRGSRLAQVLRHSKQIKTGENECDLARPLKEQSLSVLGIAKLVEALLREQQGVKGTRDAIDQHLTHFLLHGDGIKSTIDVRGSTMSEPARILELLERLDLHLDGTGRLGLGSNNILFMACELLLLARDDEGSKLLLIEEPEAHLHAQRQLRAMTFLQEEAESQGIQILVTTHSPNLASAIDLNNIVMLSSRQAFPMSEGFTELVPSDYRFLQRFLDVTKANLFFARGVMIVEGDAENILLPTLARLIGRDFTEHGVSIVNVGGVGLRRYARIFQRKGVTDQTQYLNVPVACVTDMDLMPDCAGNITDKAVPTKGSLGAGGLNERRATLREKASGQCVHTFVADQWTLEYDLAFSGLAKDVFLAARLSKKDEALDDAKLAAESKAGEEAFATLENEAKTLVSGNKAEGCTYEEVVASMVYAEFSKGTKASKAISAQYLARRLEDAVENGAMTPADLRSKLPQYLIGAIEYVTPIPAAEKPSDDTGPT
jgi:putative ATP-dependent endonuclease of OLD family